MGLGTKLDGAVSETLRSFVNERRAGLCEDLLPIALIGVTIHLILMGFTIMRGGSEDSVHMLISKWYMSAGIQRSSPLFRICAMKSNTTNLPPLHDIANSAWQELPATDFKRY